MERVGSHIVTEVFISKSDFRHLLVTNFQIQEGGLCWSRHQARQRMCLQNHGVRRRDLEVEGSFVVARSASLKVRARLGLMYSYAQPHWGRCNILEEAKTVSWCNLKGGIKNRV